MDSLAILIWQLLGSRHAVVRHSNCDESLRLDIQCAAFGTDRLLRLVYLQPGQANRTLNLLLLLGLITGLITALELLL